VSGPVTGQLRYTGRPVGYLGGVQNLTSDVPSLRPLAGRRRLASELRDALDAGDETRLAALADARPRDRRDAALTLALVHDLHLAPVDEIGPAVRFQHHPAVAALKGRLEERYLRELRRSDAAHRWDLPDDPVAAVRAVAARDQVPELYRWVADRADRQELVAYLALEGGPDGGFDDLVAICQVGLSGEPKLELGHNYWDEMGGGDPDRVHTTLYRRFVRAVDLPVLPREEQPTEALERVLLGSLVATNRALQPEMVGALGLIELQAGPRCRRVLTGFERLGFGADARDFYEEHAVADPRHGKDWLDRVIAPLAGDPFWAEGIVRGARWRWLVNDAFFAAMVDRFVPATRPAGGRLAS
jgi:hypothetical protein